MRLPSRFGAACCKSDRAGQDLQKTAGWQLQILMFRDRQEYANVHDQEAPQDWT
jgi:hypothetical protein